MTTDANVTVSKSQTKTMLETQVDSLQNLIDRRKRWLNNPDNKARKTYNEVVRDTNEIESQLEELTEELNAQKQ